MAYAESQLKIIRKKWPDLIELPKPSLDAVIVEFLKKYEVYASPVTSKTQKKGEAAVAGAITGAFGADVGGDAVLISGQNKQTQVQEWTQWKQWALDHKDFPAFKEEALEKIRKHNESIPLRLEEKKDEIENLLKKRAKGNAFLVPVIILAVLIPFTIKSVEDYLTDWPAELERAEKELDECTWDFLCNQIQEEIDEINKQIEKRSR